MEDGDMYEGWIWRMGMRMKMGMEHKDEEWGWGSSEHFQKL